VRWLIGKPFATWDLETTGVNVETDQIVTGSITVLSPGEPTWLLDTGSWLAAVKHIPAEASAVHGITTDFAQANGEPPFDVIRSIREALGDLLSGHMAIAGMNLAFDFTILDRECRRWGLPPLTDLNRVIDVYVIDKWLDPYRPGGRKLTDMVQFYGVRHDGAHDSTSDAIAAARIAYRMALVTRTEHYQLKEFYKTVGRRRPEEIADRWTELATMDPTILHQAQIGWRQEQQGSLAEYLRAKGNPDPDCDPHWPIKPLPRGKETDDGS